jgi:hypothetical protein
MMRVLQSQNATSWTNSIDGNEETEKINVDKLFAIFLALLVLFLAWWWIKCGGDRRHPQEEEQLGDERQQQENVRSRRHRVVPEMMGAPCDGETKTEQTPVLRKEILLEHFRSNGKQMVRYVQCILHPLTDLF